jgi:carbon monoxide dehydrogenase subunit G
MRVTGTATLNAPAERVWDALNDPAVLARTIPGCQWLQEVAPDEYRMTISAGVASIKGTYQGDVRLTDRSRPDSFTLKASGAGAPGTVSADVKVRLAAAGDGATRLDYDADAIVGGPIGGVGQRVLVGAAKKTASEFLTNVGDALAREAAPTAGAALAGAAESAVAGAPAGGRVYEGPPAVPRAAGAPDFARGVVAGAAAALLGAFVGGWIARRR